METYDTLVETINALKKEGYTKDFNLKHDRIECSETKSTYTTPTFQVDRFFRFEGESNPDDNSILYAITAEDGSKGLMVDAYGVYADSISDDMLNKLKMPN